MSNREEVNSMSGRGPAMLGVVGGIMLVVAGVVMGLSVVQQGGRVKLPILLLIGGAALALKSGQTLMHH